MKLLIADDEMQIRTGLAEGIDWTEIGISDVGTAENGLEALTYCRENKPDIIITDICMPGMNGLQFAGEILREYSPVKLIILSGYSEFEYAKEAVRLGAFDYLLKPIHIPDLLACTERAMEEIAKEKADIKSLRDARSIHNEQEIKALVQSGAFSDAASFERLKSIIGIDITKPVAVGMYSCDEDDYLIQNKTISFLSDYISSERKMSSCKSLYGTNDSIFFVTEIFSEPEYMRKREMLTREWSCFNDRMCRNPGTSTVSCAFSRIGEGRDIPLLVKECEQLMKNRLWNGFENIYFNEDMISNDEITVSPVKPEAVREYVRSFDYNLAHGYIEEIFDSLRELRVTSVDFVKGICQELKNILIGTVSEKGVDVKNILEGNELLINEIPDYRVAEKYLSWIDNLYYLVLNGMAQMTGKQHTRAIVMAIDYISRNYASDINLELTAEYVNKSKNYFSYLFKKETGVAFVEYLNKVRIENAKSLLLSTDDMTYEIAEKVGYNDYKYFSSIFKKIVGMSPAAYRKSEASGQQQQ